MGFEGQFAQILSESRSEILVHTPSFSPWVFQIGDTGTKDITAKSARTLCTNLIEGQTLKWDTGTKDITAKFARTLCAKLIEGQTLKWDTGTKDITAKFARTLCAKLIEGQTSQIGILERKTCYIYLIHTATIKHVLAILSHYLLSKVCA